jgi:hypothetical protein
VRHGARRSHAFPSAARSARGSPPFGHIRILFQRVVSFLDGLPADCYIASGTECSNPAPSASESVSPLPRRVTRHKSRALAAGCATPSCNPSQQFRAQPARTRSPAARQSRSRLALDRGIFVDAALARTQVVRLPPP